MRCILTLLALLTVMVGNASNSYRDRLMALDPFDRACVLIRHFETLHKPQHWPTIGYGHVVKKGEKYAKRQYSSIEADRIMRKDLRHLQDYYSAYGPDKSLLLALLAYNVGPAKVDKSSIPRKLLAGEDITAEYTSFCHYRGRAHPGLYRRRWLELTLFLNP